MTEYVLNDKFKIDELYLSVFAIDLDKYLPSGTLQNYSSQIRIEKDTGRQCAVFAAETIERNKNIGTKWVYSNYNGPFGVF